MARGWESKSVAAQQESNDRADGGGSKGSSDDRDRESKRNVMLLSRARTAADLARAAAPAQREMLERALADLDRMIGELSTRPS